MSRAYTIAVCFLIGITSIYGISLEEKNNLCDQLLKRPSFVHTFMQQIKDEGGCDDFTCDYYAGLLNAPVNYGDAKLYGTLNCENPTTVSEDFIKKCDKIRNMAIRITQNVQNFGMGNVKKIIEKFVVSYPHHIEKLIGTIGCQ